MLIPSQIADHLSEDQLAFLQSFFAKSPESLGSCIQLKTYRKNHVLINTDDTCAHVYLLLQGRLQAIEERVAGEAFHFTEVSAIEIVGDFELFTRLPNRIITLTTLEKTRCLMIPAADYLSWIKQDANGLFIRTKMLISQLVAQTRFERQNFFLDNQTRLLYFLYRECGKQKDLSFPFSIKSTRQTMAGKLGCSVRTVNRTINALEEEGILKTEHGKVQIDRAQHGLIQEKVNQALCELS